MPEMALATPRIPTIIAVAGGEDNLLSSVAIVDSLKAIAIVSGRHQAGMGKPCLSTGESCPYPLATGSGIDKVVRWIDIRSSAARDAPEWLSPFVAMYDVGCGQQSMVDAIAIGSVNVTCGAMEGGKAPITVQSSGRHPRILVGRSESGNESARMGSDGDTMAERLIGEERIP